MATRTWTGTSSTDWHTTGNWDEGAVPTEVDDVYFNGQQATQGVTASADIEFDTLNVGEDFGYNMFNSGNPGAVNNNAGAVDATLVDYRGTGDCYLQAASGQTINLVNVNTTNRRQTAFQIGGAGTVDQLNVLRGHCTVQSSIGTLTFCLISYVENVIGDAILVWEGSGSGFAELRQVGGRSLLQSGVTTVHLHNGKIEVTTGAITTLNVCGGTFIYNSNGTIIGTVNQAGGIVDLSQNVLGKEITLYNLFAGVLDAGGNVNIVLTTLNQYLPGVFNRRGGQTPGTWNQYG